MGRQQDLNCLIHSVERKNHSSLLSLSALEPRFLLDGAMFMTMDVLYMENDTSKVQKNTSDDSVNNIQSQYILEDIILQFQNFTLDDENKSNAYNIIPEDTLNNTLQTEDSSNSEDDTQIWTNLMDHWLTPSYEISNEYSINQENDSFSEVIQKYGHEFEKEKVALLEYIYDIA